MSELGSGKTGWVLALALVAFVACAAFSPWLFFGKVLAPLDIVEEMFLPWRGDKMHPSVHNHMTTDVVLQHIPYRLVMHESLRRDGYVGWNPFVFGGTPQHANTVMITNEATMLLHRFCDFWVAWNLGRFLQILVAGAAMLGFLRYIGSAPGTALLGAVAYMLNHQFVVWIYFHQLVAAFCWMPAVLWALCMAHTRSTRYAAAAAVFISLSLLGATLQQATYILAVIGCLWVGWLIDGRGAKGNLGRSTLVIAIPSLLGAGLAAFALEPSIAAFLDNGRSGHARGSFGYDSGWSQPLWHLLSSPLTLYPFLLGSMQSLDLWKLLKSDIGNAGFFGTVPMILACAGLFCRRVPTAAKLMMIVGVLIPLTPLVGFVYVRFNIVWIIGGCWAAGAWLNQAAYAQLARLSRTLLSLALTLATIWGIASLLLLWVGPALKGPLQAKVLSMASGSAYGLFTGWLMERSDRLLDYLCVWHPLQMTALAGLLLSIVGLPWVKNPRIFCYTAAFGVALQASVFWWQVTTWSEPRLPYGASSLEQVLKERVTAHGRLAMNSMPWAEYTAPPNSLMPSGIPITGGYDSIHPFGMRSLSGVEWEFPGTTHYLGRIDEPLPPHWLAVWTDGDWRLMENPSPSMGAVHLVGRTDAMPLRPQNVERPTHNTLQVLVPQGTTSLTVYSNWHRGWAWRTDANQGWKKVGLGDNRCMRIDFPSPASTDGVVYFRYNPEPPAWVTSIVLLSVVAVALVGIFGRRLARSAEGASPEAPIA